MNTQEKIVCPAVKITFANGGEKDEVVMPYIKSHKDEYHIFLLLIKLGIWRTKRYTEELGFATSNQRFVSAKEAKKISVYNDNRVDYGIYKEMERLRKEIAKANNKRNRGDLSVELSLNILMNKHSELEAKLNEFRGRDYLLLEDLY